MINKKLILGIGLSVILASCSSTKNIHNIPVPEGTANVISLPAKKGSLSEIEIQKWPQADLKTDTIPGISLEKAYQFLSDKKAKTIIVGILDSGIDITHEDLKGNEWINPKEIAENGKDDDKNGYIDDINGWNFLGGKGTATPEQLEVTRIYKKLHEKFGDKTEAQISDADKEDFAYYQKVKKDFEKRLVEAKTNYDYYLKTQKYLEEADKNISEKLNKKVYSLADMNTLPEKDKSPLIMRVLGAGGTVAEVKDQIKGGIKHFASQVDVMYNLDFKGRTTGDDPYDIKDIPYGNGYVIGSLEDEMHGTHVAGITLATRHNGKGIDGVASHVKLLTVRTVPDGDEYDKDVALAIRYAVDNGAKVINMSFGKSYSPNPEWVYDAIKYAASKDVLLVHAAGNDGKNIDKSDNFPNDSSDKINEFADNMITVGAMTRQYNENLVATFSNYGKLNVDIFAPGFEIYSTVPNNKYESLQGTSMAAPEVTGVAALIRAYYPELSASQVKHILMNSGTKIDFEVLLPKGNGKKVPFSDLSVSGRVLNAYNALKMADEIVNGK